jgi:methyltransferase (TIGR00027 family)
MKDDKPSQTAAWVAAWRGLAPWLPEGAQLAQDPFGLAFAPIAARPLSELAARAPSVLRAILKRGWLAHMIAWLQLRTRSLDDRLLAFVRAGGRQVVLLGAGFDCRAARLANSLDGVTVFEVDHPATQSRKRDVLSRLAPPSARVEYVAWNFERNAMETLGAHLPGHDPAKPTFTIWEGVIPYLTEPAIAATVAAVRGYSRAPAGTASATMTSQLAFSYWEPQALDESGPWRRAVELLGEPWKFGWRADELPAWMAAHGLKLVSDESEAELAARLWPRGFTAPLGKPGRRVGLAEPLH